MNRRRTTPRRLVVQPKKGKKQKKPTTSEEIGFIGKALRGLGSLGGSTLGALVGAPGAGGAVGSSLGAAMSKWLGAGDYTVGKNTLVQRASANIPMMHNTGQTVTVRHREFIGSINGSANFEVKYALPLNPGMAATFPWLSKIASRFQEYEFKGLVFHYVPTSGTFNGSTAALGTVMLQTTYRSTDAAPTSKVEILNEYCANETVPFETMVHPIECDPRENPFAVHYVRAGATVGSEPLMYDIGTTFVATQGMFDTGVVGDLWATYEVELKKPLITSSVLASASYYARTFGGPTSSSFFSGTAGTQIGNLEVTAATKTITLPARNDNFFIVAEIFSVGGLLHATAVQWTGALVTTNATAWLYNGTQSTEDNVATGTTVTIDTLRWTVGVRLIDSTQPGTITFPNAQWTSGTTTNTSLVVVATGA